MNEHDDTFLTIGAVARRTGVSAQAIRYYERIGLLPRPARHTNGYRYYSETDVKRVLLVHRMRSLGTPLATAKPLVDAVTRARCADIQHDLLRVASARLGEIDAEIAALYHLRAEVATFQRALAAFAITSDQSFVDCPDARCVTQPERCYSPTKEDAMTYQFADCDCDCCTGTCDCGCCQTA